MNTRKRNCAAALATLDLPADWVVEVLVEDRKTFGLAVGPRNEVIIKVPPRTFAEDIAAMVDHHRAGIAEALAEARRLTPSTCVKELVDGTMFLLAGQEYRLAVVDGPWRHDEGAVSDDAGVLRVRRGSVDEMRAAIVGWLCGEGAEWACEAGREFERRGGIEGLQYAVSDLNGDWSRYMDGEVGHAVILNWWALSLPYEQLEYLLVHELAHATRPDGTSHGKEWRDLMDAWLPGWRRHRRALNRIEHTAWTGLCVETDTEESA